MKWWPLLLAPLSGCLTLDYFVFNGVPCTEVDESTCDVDKWHQLCVTCPEDYDWQRDYAWMPGTLQQGESIRGIDDALVRQFTLPTDDGLGALDVWFLQSHGEDARLSTTTILYSHGNYASIEHYQPRIRMLYEAGYNVLVWDYRGYGKTTPYEHPTPEQFMADAQQVRRWAPSVAPDAGRIVLYGYSLGGLPAVEMATNAPGCATVLEAPFSSFEQIVNANTTLDMGERFFSEGRFDNIAKIRNHDAPLFVMVGDEDRTTPASKVEVLYQAAPEPKELWVLAGAGHGISDGGIPEAGLTTYSDRILTFLERDAPGCVLAF